MADSESDIPERGRYRVGECIVEPRLNQVARGGQTVRLEPRTMDVLVMLCRRQGDVVSADEIIADVWRGRPMGDNPVYKAVAKIRQALDDDPKAPRYVVTVPKKGYRLIAAVSEAPEEGGARGRSRHWRPLASIAVGVAVGFLAAVFIVSRSPDLPSIELVSTFAGSHSQPSYAPDGHSIAFVSNAAGSNDIWVLEAGRSSPRQLTFGAARDIRPRWSPSGGAILFQRDGDIWAVTPAGGDEHELVRDAYHPNWSHDGRQIVFERRYEIWLADADGGGQRRLEGISRPELPLSPRWPAFSPSGAEIVYFEPNGTPMGDLWLVASGGGEPTRLTHASSFGSAPVWSPDGRYIYYSTQRGGSRTLWRVATGDGAAEPILVGSGDDDFPDVSADGRRIVYSNSREIFTLVETDPRTGVERTVYDSRRTIIGPKLSPDGDRVAAFGGAQVGGIQLFVVPAAGGERGIVTNEPDVAHAMPQWSADGSGLYFYLAGAKAGFARLDLASGRQELLNASWNWNVANGAVVDPDGDRVMYSRLVGQVPVQTRIWQLESDEDTGFHATLEYPRWSHDGQRVLGSRFVDQRFPGDVAICEVERPECRVIAERGRVAMWSADETEVYFVRGFGVAQELFVVDAAGGGERFVMNMQPLFPLGPFYDVTADGKIVWVKYEQQKGDLWVASLDESE